MSMGRARGVVLFGMDGHLIEVEADIGRALPGFILLGLPDASMRESQDRIRSAAKNTGIDLPARRLTVNLLPASLPKSGLVLDLAILISAWAADGRVHRTSEVVFLAELGLDGRLRPVRGVLPAVAAAQAAGAQTVVVAQENAQEAALVPGMEVLAGSHVRQAAASFASAALEPLVRDAPGLERWSADRSLEAPVLVDPSQPARSPQVCSADLRGEVDDGRPLSCDPAPDLAEVRGQQEARFSLELAAAGGHHLLLIGAPGAGKTMLAERMSGILPPLDDQAAMEATAIESISAEPRTVTRLRRTPPFQAPHHSASMAAIVGGGARIARPGAVTRAHRGVLFLDEAPEFPRHALDALRQPLETGRISLHRSAGSVTYPARFQLVLAANPCPCGLNVGAGTGCRCSVAQRRNYMARLSGPLLDRIDLQIQVDRPRSAADALGPPGESSAVVRARVLDARGAQRERLRLWGLRTNSQAPMQLLTGDLRLPAGATRHIDAALDRAAISLRGYLRVLRLAWTIADLMHNDRPGADEVDAALQLRQRSHKT
ncbi:YifB family Mg chelatase-like AAA ATPase [Nesterenkonia sp. YGD6]|uniref:YifB family Mg chelatase-like AAA ATPase n=1 Tax=Nesterenkonia sp. YGD6 TaxID=2901231 RepID=UPI001F4C9001|nr:YifB family Mg chelatase-like AAA ATPase [Nesterenkonia sp. YGD6]MCH8562459.1 YifB family Mg chelatase-like AAA ATPase [Nesterenkonia sp. YGD6]